MHYVFLGLFFIGTLFSSPLPAHAACLAAEVGDIRHLACPIGQYGVRTQRCLATTVWSDIGTTCDLIDCAGGVDIGETAGDTSSCPSNFTDVKATGATNFVKTCLLPLLNDPDGVFYVTQTACKPYYTACSGSVSRILTCPTNTVFPTSQQPGHITQKCNGSFYQTIEDTCVPTTCNGQPVGSYRSFKGKDCPEGRKGTLLEICMPSGQWEVSLANCGQLKCMAVVANNINWATTNAGSTASTAAGSTCVSGVATPSPVTRACDASGQWKEATGLCM